MKELITPEPLKISYKNNSLTQLGGEILEHGKRLKASDISC
jgi:hypothetical protein